MLKHRIIPCLLLKDWQLVKSVKFKDYRTIGHPKVTARIYNNRNVDELIVLDIDASISKSINFKALKMIADECYMPLTLGGGICCMEDVRKLMKLGADKVSINRSALDNPGLISDIVKKYGSQSLIISVDVQKINSEYQIIIDGKVIEGLKVEDHLQNMQELGAGEILLTSIDRDGTQKGYDFELLEKLRKDVKIPLIINGGAGKVEDFHRAVEYGADATAAASIFHFTKSTPNDVRKHLFLNNVAVRYFQ